MRKEFTQQTGENTKDYLTRAARIYASICNGTPLEDGTVLKDTISEEERTDFMNYLMGIMNPIIVRVVECESRAAHLTLQVQEILLSRVYEMVLSDFGKFNNYKADSEERYTFESFLKNKIGDIIRNSVAEDQGIGVNRSRMREYVFKVRASLASERGIDEDRVPVDDICECINSENKKKGARNISRKLVMEVLSLQKGFVSTSEMEENGEQISSLQCGLVTEFDSEMDYDTKCILDVAFENFSGLDFYLLMKRYYLLGGEIRNQEMSEFVETPLFKKLFEEDSTIRSKADPIKTSYNKQKKIEKTLASLNGKVNMSELVGTLEAYIKARMSAYIG